MFVVDLWYLCFDFTMKTLQRLNVHEHPGQQGELQLGLDGCLQVDVAAERQHPQGVSSEQGSRGALNASRATSIID